MDLRNIDQEFVNEPVPASVVHHQSVRACGEGCGAGSCLAFRVECNWRVDTCSRAGGLQVENLISVKVSEADVFQGFSYTAGVDSALAQPS
jgi:hypothetical protein